MIRVQFTLFDNMAKQHTLRKFTKYMEDKSYKDLNTLSETELKNSRICI